MQQFGHATEDGAGLFVPEMLKRPSTEGTTYWRAGLLSQPIRFVNIAKAPNRHWRFPPKFLRKFTQPLFSRSHLPRAALDLCDLEEFWA
jgi:hypothetical protein